MSGQKSGPRGRNTSTSRRTPTVRHAPPSQDRTRREDILLAAPPFSGGPPSLRSVGAASPGPPFLGRFGFPPPPSDTSFVSDSRQTTPRMRDLPAPKKSPS